MGRVMEKDANKGDDELMVIILLKLFNIEITIFIPVGASCLNRVHKLDKKLLKQKKDMLIP